MRLVGGKLAGSLRLAIAVALTLLGIGLLAPWQAIARHRPWDQGAPTANVVGFGAHEGWITCAKSDRSCNSTPQPVDVPPGVRFVRIDASDASNLAIDTAGDVWAWGENHFGALGDGSTDSSVAPVRVENLRHVVLTDTGNSDAVALERNGTVWAWGNNRSGQLCDGQQGGYVTTPQEISSLSSLPRGEKVTSLSAGGNTTAFLLSNGTVRTCGSNVDGVLGTGSPRWFSDEPVRVPNLRGHPGPLRNVVAITSGDRFVGALLSNGTVVDWGNNSSGQLGDGTTTNSSTPVRVKELNGVAAISYGGDEFFNGQSMALLYNGTVRDWGDNADGQLGNGTTTDSSLPVPVTVSDGHSAYVTSIAAGGTHSIALLSDGNVMVWGGNTVGQLGNGTTTNSDVPIEVVGLGAKNAAFISAGAVDSLVALKRPPPASAR